MSSIDNNLGGGGGSASASGKKGAIQLSDGNFNLTSNKELKSDPKTGTITTTGLTTTGTVYASTVSATTLIVDTLTESLTVVGDASITGDVIVDNTLTTGWATVSGTLTAVSITGTTADISGEIKAGTLSSTGNGYFSSNVGVGTTDTAEYKLLVKDGTSNLFGVPYNTSGLSEGKTIVYDGSGWVYDNAGPADGTQTGEILTWDGTEWSANSTVVIEGTSVGIGSTQPTQKLDVVGNVKATEFIGSGAALSGLNASNVTSGTLSNSRLPGTISVSNLEATANLVVGGPADITGTLSASSIIGSGAGISTLNASNVTSGTLSNSRLPGTISVSNLEATANLVVGGPANIAGSVSAGAIDGSSLTVTGVVQGLNLTSTGTLSSAGITSSDNVTITGADKSLTASNITTSNLIVSNFHSITGTLSASNVETSNLTVSNRLSGGTISVSNIEATANLMVGGPVDITGTLSAGGSLTGTSLTVSDQVQGATVSSTGHVIATGSVTGTTINTPTLVVSKDAQITGNLTVSGGLVTITSTTTGTNQINITNNGTGPALIANQTGNQPVVNFLDDNASVLFISGGELTGKDGFVGLGTEAPQERLDVRGNIVSNGTISSTNVATSNLTVSNRLSGGTISVSNVEATANLVVGGPVDITGTLSVGGSLTGPSLTVSDQVQGATISSTGHIIATGSLTGASLSVTGDVRGLNLTSTGTLSAVGITSSDNVTISGADKILTVSNISTSNLTVSNRLSGGTISVSNIEATANLVVGGSVDVTGTLSTAGITSSDNVTISGADKSITVSNISTSNLTVSNRLSGGTISVSNIEATANLVVGGPVDITGTLSAGAIGGSSLTVTGDAQGLNLTATGTLSATGITSSDNVTITGVDKSLTASNISTSNLTVSNFQSITGTLSASNVETSNLTVNGNTYISSNLGVGTADTAEYKFLVNDGINNLFGVPYDTANLSTGKTIVYNGSGWVYDNAGPADGTQTGEILSWDGSEWSANSAVVVEGSNVGIGSTQPREILDVTGNVRVTQSVLINETFQGRAMRLNDTPASNLHYQPNFTITGSLTSAGDIKTNQAFRGHNMFLSNVLTISGGVVTNTGTVDTTVNGTLTVQGDAVVNSNISAVSVNTGDVISNRAVHGKAIRLGNTPESNVYYNPNLTVSGSITAGGDVKSGTTFRGPDMVLSGTASIGTLTTSNITHGSELTVTTNLLMGSGSTLTTSNIVGSPSLTLTANTNVVAEFTESTRYYNVKEPRSAMTANSSFGYTASASSINTASYDAYKAFDTGTTSNWVSAAGKYNSSTGAYEGSTTFEGVSGEWIKLQMPSSISLGYINLYKPPDATSPNPPKSGRIFASQDGSTWTQIYSFTNLSYSSNDLAVLNINSTNYYSYYNIVIESVITGWSQTYTSIDEIEYYGTPYTAATNDGTDVIFKSVPNTPKTDFLDVYYDASNTNSSSTVVKNIVDDSSATPVDLTFTSTDPKAWYFDGSTSNVTGTHGLGTGNVPHSHAVWFKRTSAINTWDYVCSIGTFTNDQQSAIAINSNQINWSIYATNIRASPIIENDTWYHVVISYNGQNSTTEIYINGLIQNVTVEGAGTLNLTGTTLKLGCRPGDGDYFNGSIANYRLYDRPLSADEVWELYGYQKAYFSVSPDVVTYKAGRVGIGTSEPRAVLDVVGSLNLTNGITYNNIRSMFSAYSTNGDSSASWPIILEKTGYNIGNHYDTTTGWYTVPITGIYSFNILVFATNGVGSTQYALKMKPGGQSVFGNDNWKANRLATGGDDSFLIYAVGGFPFSGSLDIYCEEGDMVGWGHRSTTVSLYYAHCAFSGRLITPI